MNHADRRYLAAKRSVDERALSRRVRDELLDAIPAAPRIVEVGCGTGVTVPRLLSWGVTDFDYRGIDADAGVVAFARDVLPKELRRRGYDATSTPFGGRVGDASVRFEVGDALEELSSVSADLVVAQAFLDLVPLEPAVEAVETALSPGGLAYFPITFDGGTVFQPDHPADDDVERAYHAAIDDDAGRDSRAGRHLIDLLRERDGSLVAVAPSDWVVRPRDGTYPADERFFLDRILGFVEEAVEPGSAAADAAISGDAFGDWLATRRRQLADGDLVYVAHQYDLLYRTQP